MKISEGAVQGDLQRLVTPEVHIDQYRSKMGDDDDIVVISFKVTGKDPATDLVNFLEAGYDYVLDSDLSTGEISPDNFLVFVELSRRSVVPAQIYQMVEEILNLTTQKIKEWHFMYGKIDDERQRESKMKKYPLTLENLEQIIPISPKEYRDNIEITEEESEEESEELPPVITPTGQDDDEIADLKTNAGVPVNQTAPNDNYTAALKAMSGQA